jgi:sucrose-6-phosphate hydrolase SacC (GH32 family)
MILLYTAAGEPFVQCLAYSNDRGRTFTKYAQNPILKNITAGNRDPKVIWYEPTQQWIMTLYVEVDGKQTIQFFASSNLKEWKLQSQVDGFFECPDLFPLALDGDADKTKWVLTAASSEYMVGTFDGHTFHPETAKLPGHRGNAFYAAQTFSDIPRADGRRIQIGWGQMPAPGMPFNQIMCLPCELTLHSTDAGPRLAWKPVREFREQFKERPANLDGNITADKSRTLHLTSEALDVEVEFQIIDAQQVRIDLRGIEIVCDVQAKELRCLGKVAPVALDEKRLKLRAILDRTSLEIFADDGLVYMPLAVIPGADKELISIHAQGGTCNVPKAEVRQLPSIW